MDISSRQLFWLLWMFDIGMSLLLTISMTIHIAKQDAWISALIAIIAGTLITFIAIKVSLSHPHKTLIDISSSLLGTWFGKIVAVFYLVMWISVTAIILRECADFLHVALFDKTPLWVILLTFLSVMIYVVTHSGLEGIARISEILGPVAVVGIVVALLMSLGQVKYHLALPIYGEIGWQKILHGSVPGLSFLGESVVVMMLIPFVHDQKKATSRSLKAVLLAGLFVAAADLFVVFMFGPNLPGNMIYPSFEFTRYISMMEFVQNIDVIFVLVWMFSFFIKLTLYLFVSSYGVSQWLGIKQWRRTVFILSVVIFIMALFPSFVWVKTIYLEKFWIPYVLPINMLGIPCLLWGLTLIKRKGFKAPR